MPDRLEQILGLLRERGGRVTTARRAIITALLESPGHVTADEITSRVQKRHPDVHQSTIYRCLDTLEELQVVDHVHLGHGRAVYHLTDEHHHHLVCESCGKVVEVPDDIFGDVSRRLRRDFKFTVDIGHFALSGLCAKCDSRR